MFQLNILSGKKAGTSIVARHFPFQVGRAASSDLSLQDPGIFDQHFSIDLRLSDGFVLQLHPNAFLATGGQQSGEPIFLRNGDVVEAGPVKIQFALSATKQQSLIPREMSTWMALALLCVCQIALICWLLR